MAATMKSAISSILVAAVAVSSVGVAVAHEGHAHAPAPGPGMSSGENAAAGLVPVSMVASMVVALTGFVAARFFQ